MTGRAKKVPNPTACQDGQYDLSVTLPSCRDFITDPPFSRAFSHDSTTFATNPRVVGSVTGSVPVETLHYIALLGSYSHFNLCLCYCLHVKILN